MPGSIGSTLSENCSDDLGGRHVEDGLIRRRRRDEFGVGEGDADPRGERPDDRHQDRDPRTAAGGVTSPRPALLRFGAVGRCVVRRVRRRRRPLGRGGRRARRPPPTRNTARTEMTKMIVPGVRSSRRCRSIPTAVVVGVGRRWSSARCRCGRRPRRARAHVGGVGRAASGW